MAETIASPPAPLLRVPPFPGALPVALVRPSSPPDPSRAVLDRTLAAIRADRLGGNYWGLQPPLPASPFILIRISDAAARDRLVEGLPSDRPILCWVDDEPAGLDSMRASFVLGDCDPWHLASGAAEVFTDVGDELVHIAALAGAVVRGPDGVAVGNVDDSLRQTVFGPFTYVDPFTGDAIDVEQAVALSAHWRRLIDGNRQFGSAIGFAGWKQETAAPLLWPGAQGLAFTNRARPGEHKGSIAAWKSRVPRAMMAQLERAGAEMVEVEDGFIRSVGLGANCVPPLSLVVDRLGVHFDPHQPSELERMLEQDSFAADVVARARSLRELIVAAGVSKYAVGGQALRRRTAARHVLVPGQVEDDRSVLCGGGAVTTNIELLRRVRRDAPDAYILYKPHPDVEAGHRAGAVPDEAAAELADEIVRGASITSLIDLCDAVHVNTSLAGFEALLRHKPVTTHGVPFYAGWGLTRDLGAVPARRTTRRSLDELVGAALLLYPRYLDPVTGLPCTAEVLVRRLAEGQARPAAGPLVPLRRLQGLVRRGFGRLTAGAAR